MKYFWRQSVAPLSLAAVFMGLIALHHFNVIPHPSDLLPQLSQRPSVVAVFAMLENCVGLNLWFPGSVVIISSMAATAGQPGLAVRVFAAILLGSIVAQNCDYWIGRALRSRKLIEGGDLLMEGTITVTSKYWWFLFAGAMWHPQSAALASLFAGTQGLPYARYLKYMISAGTIWGIVWGLTLYLVGGSLNVAENLDILVVICVAGWLGYNAWMAVRHGRKASDTRSHS